MNLIAELSATVTGTAAADIANCAASPVDARRHFTERKSPGARHSAESETTAALPARPVLDEGGRHSHQTPLSWLAASLPLALALGISLSPSPAAAKWWRHSAPPSPAPAVTAMRAYDFYSKFGINTDINTGQTISSILTDLQYLGLYNIRDSIFSEGYATAFAGLAAEGVKLHMDFQGWVNPAPKMSDWLSWLKNHLVVPYPRSIVGVSGPNEVDNTGAAFVYNGLSGIAAANQAQKDLYNGVKADPVLKNIPIDMWPLAFAYSTNDNDNRSAIGDQTAFCDRANLHDYYAADNYNQPTYPALGDLQISLQQYLKNARQVCNRQSFVTTETGWYTPTRAGWQGSGTNEYAQARLLLNDLFDHAMLPDNKFVYIFTLRWGSADFSDPGYGVIHDDGTPKISGTAIHNLMSILNDPSANAATFLPSPLNYSLVGMPSASGNFAIQKSSGAFDIILWNETPIWDNSTVTQISIPTNTVTVSLPSRSSVIVYNPLQGAGPIKTFRGVNQLQVSLNDAPLIIEVIAPF
jgi:hypothetical protein